MDFPILGQHQHGGIAPQDRDHDPQAVELRWTVTVAGRAFGSRGGVTGKGRVPTFQREKGLGKTREFRLAQQMTWMTWKCSHIFSNGLVFQWIGFRENAGKAQLVGGPGPPL